MLRLHHLYSIPLEGVDLQRTIWSGAPLRVAGGMSRAQKSSEMSIPRKYSYKQHRRLGVTREALKKVGLGRASHS